MSDILYYNIAISGINNQNSGLPLDQSNIPIKSAISADNNQPIVNNPDDYYASIIRFSIPSFEIPVIGPFLIQTPVNNINLSVYSFTLNYSSVNSDTTFWIFTPDVLSPNVTPPQVGTPLQTFTSYYFLYNYITLMNIMNTALESALTNLKSKAGTTAITDAPVPFFYYDPNTNLINLYADKTYYDNSLTNPISIYFNSPAQTFFNALPFKSIDENNIIGKDNIFIIQNNENINIVTLNTFDYIVMTQEYQSLGYMALLKSIIIGTNMNVQSEIFFINNPQAFQNLNFVNVLTDYLPDINSNNDAGVSSKNFIYNAPSLYRLFEFKQRTPLYNISANIYFTDNLNNLYPLYLKKGTIANIKIMFIKKKLITKFLI